MTRYALRPMTETAPALDESGVFPQLADTFEPTLVDARLTLDLDAVDRALGAAAYDPSMAAPTMRERLQDMRDIDDALARIHGLSLFAGLAPLFGPRTALSRYMRGVHRWCASFARICDELADELRAGRPARWSTLRASVADAARSHDLDLRSQATVDVALLRDEQPCLRGVHDSLRAELEHLFAAVDWFEESTRRYIGSRVEAA